MTKVFRHESGDLAVIGTSEFTLVDVETGRAQVYGYPFMSIGAGDDTFATIDNSERATQMISKMGYREI